jgi:hypothetical protein
MPRRAETLEIDRRADLLSMAQQAVREVLETMFFSTAAPVDCRHSVPEKWLSSRVRFESAALTGELTAMLSPELARSIAAGFLGEDSQEVGAQNAELVSCELANMICGTLLSRFHPDSQVALGAPELAAAGFGDGSAGVHQCFETPDGRLSITLRIDGQRSHQG